MIEVGSLSASYVRGVGGPTFPAFAPFGVQISVGRPGSVPLRVLCGSVVKVFPGPLTDA